MGICPQGRGLVYWVTIMMRRVLAWFLPVYLGLVSLLPFSHCHSLEENHPGLFFSLDLCEHACAHAGPVVTQIHTGCGEGAPSMAPDWALPRGRVGCSRPSDAHGHGHRHFLAEYFHHDGDRRKLLPMPVVVPGRAFAPSDRQEPVVGLRVLFRDPPAWQRGGGHFARRVSGMSPPVVVRGA